ncbi:MAG TPA: biotin carboxylase N-terminal domain-containing protein [Roseiflexaceae bacterium]|nr:biotin carboxylase N-terminal domain-containing protein [Roseiflexaceae bacterium]
MFKKILIANRGEIAVRIERTCREMGIQSVALYHPSDIGSLHVRLADQALRLTSELGYLDQEAIIAHALEHGAEAIHPGYGFLAEQPEFARACAAAGLIFIGPRPEVIAAVRNKIATLECVGAARFHIAQHSPATFGVGDLEQLRAAAGTLGYPLVIKSCRGGRGRGTRVVRSPEHLDEAVRHAQAGAEALFGDAQVYLERAILPSRYVEVQLLGDGHGNLIHLGERDTSIQRNNQKIVTEAPAPSLEQAQREALWRDAIEIGRLFGCHSACTVEFVIDGDGRRYFTEIKARIQIEHSISEMIANVDIVREQIRIADSEQLSISQADIALSGSAMQCRINAEDPWNRFLPSPGHITGLRLPGGPFVRVDTYVSCGCEIPLHYDPIFAKLVTWGADRDACVSRMRRALEECSVAGIQTNIPLLHGVLRDPDFIRGVYTTEFSRRPLITNDTSERELHDLAAAAAVAYLRRVAGSQISLPERLSSGWHQNSRHLPE